MGKKALQYGGEITIAKDRNYRLVTDILEYIVDKYPNKGMTYIAPTGDEIFVSYTEMKQKALMYLGALQSRGVKPGDVIAVEVDDPRLYHLMFWACAYGGIIVTSINQPATWQVNPGVLDVFVKQLQQLKMPYLVTQKAHTTYCPEVEKIAPNFKYLVIEDLESDTLGVPAEQSEDACIYIQFSSGTTGQPHGALLTHKNIIKSCVSTTELVALDEEDSVISWLPHTHNLGLFTPFIIAMIILNDGYFMTPPTFLRNPLLFLQKITEHKCAWFSINNFGLEWMINQIPDEALEQLDLSSMKTLFAGAENISDRTIARFSEKFGKCGFQRKVLRPGYGLSEATMVISVTPRDDTGAVIQYISRNALLKTNKAVPVDDITSPDCMSFTGNGVPIRELTVRIANDNGEVLDENCIGEIQATGPGVFQGYYNEPGSLEEKAKDGWLSTGDLGYLSNGNLFIVGRKKDVAVIRGVNYILTDVENVVCANTGLQKGSVVAVGVIEEQQEALAVFVEYQDEIQQFAKIYNKVSKAISDYFGLKVRQIIPIKQIPKTASGKVQRFLLKIHYEGGTYQDIISELESVVDMVDEEVEVVYAQTEMEVLVAKCWAKVLNLEYTEISVNDTFASLGGESVQAYQLLELLSKELNIDITHEIIAKCKTILEMADYLEKQNSVSENSEANAEEITDCEKIAITGIGFRVPDANTQEEFWNNLCNGKDSINRVSEKRRKLAKSDQWQDWIGELKDVDSFDYDFFDISYDEAVFMDPQHRIAMEVSYEALEDAGVVTDDDKERKVGVYASVCANTYYPLVLDYVNKNGYDNIPPQTMVDNMNNIIAARISHQYNFTGPVMAVDTACSSFSAAIHMGRKSIINNEAEGAVVIGTNIIATPYMYELAKKAGIISSTNMSKVFDANADGSILGEGVIVLYIEKLSTAIKNNKNIYGVIHGSAINNDGFALSITSPNPKGEYSVLEEAYAKSDINPEDISYFEAHGTGTAIGDPIEINALSRLFTKYKDNNNKISIGSVKTNIGHLLSTAGGAGILKVLMCLKNKQLVPSIHMDNINPLLEIDKTPFKVITDTEDWTTENNSPRIAGISSLGLGGTNTHIILGEHTKKESNNIERNHILTMSAKTMDALEKIKADTVNVLEKDSVDVNDLCMTRNRYRRHYRYRSACVIDAKGNIIDEFTTGETLKAISLKTSIYLGDLLETGTEEEFNNLYNKLKIYATVIKKFGHFYGEASGKIFADLLEGKITMDEAKKLYVGGNSKDYGKEIPSEKTFDVLMVLDNKDTQNTFTTTKTELKGALLKDNVDVLCNLKNLYVLGTDINWDILYPNGVGNIMNLPAYPFVKNSVWLD